MKKYAALLAAVILMFTACGGNEENVEIITEASDVSVSVSEADESVTAEVTSEEITADETEASETTAEIAETESQPDETTAAETAAETTAAQTTAAETTTAAQTSAVEMESDDSSEEVMVEITDEELVGDDEGSAESVSYAGTWTVTKIADDGGNTMSLKEYCQLAEISESEIKSVCTIDGDGTVSVKTNGSTVTYSSMENDGIIILSADDGFMMMQYDSSAKTISYFDETYGITKVLTK